MDDFEFSFVADEKFRELLERDFEELKTCLEYKANKSVLILSGSIIETILLEYFVHHNITSKSRNQILKLTLAELIDEAVSCGLLSVKTKDLSSVIRNYRNLIHPGKEIRTNEEFDNDTAVVSFSLVKIVLKELRANYILKYGYKAEEILNKIINDDSTESIFDLLIKKVGKFEVNRLFDLIIEYWIANRENKENRQISKLRRYFMKLKTKVGEEKIIEKLKILTEQVEKGSEATTISLFELFGSDLEKISKDDRELVLTYIYDAGGQTEFWTTGLLKFHDKFIYEYLGLYINTEEMKIKFVNLSLKIIENYHPKHQNKYFNTYEKLMGNFDLKLITKLENYFTTHLNNDKPQKFYSAYKSKDDLPF